jgi:hypothetical protein
MKEDLEAKLYDAEDEKRDFERMLDKKSTEIVSKSQEIVLLNNRIEELINSQG